MAHCNQVLLNIVSSTKLYVFGGWLISFDFLVGHQAPPPSCSDSLHNQTTQFHRVTSCMCRIPQGTLLLLSKSRERLTDDDSTRWKIFGMSIPRDFPTKCQPLPATCQSLVISLRNVNPCHMSIPRNFPTKCQPLPHVNPS
jgi:hypothetical protein